MYFLMQSGGKAILVEGSQTQFNVIKKANSQQGIASPTRMPASRAHQWVKDGHIHETALYLDNGRIRRAG